MLDREIQMCDKKMLIRITVYIHTNDSTANYISTGFTTEQREDDVELSQQVSIRYILHLKPLDFKKEKKEFWEKFLL